MIADKDHNPVLAPAKIVANLVPNPDDGVVEDAIQPSVVTPRARRETSLHWKLFRAMRWFPAYAWQRGIRRVPRGPVHLIIAVAGRFEPSVVFDDGSARAHYHEQDRRLESWCREAACDRRDGNPGGYRDYRLKRKLSSPAAQSSPEDVEKQVLES